MTKQLGSILSIGLSTILASSTCLAQEIRFAKGRKSQLVRGRWDIYNNTYTFRARKGQKLNLALRSAKGTKGTLALNIYAYCGEEYGHPIGDRVKNWTGVLPCSDEYSIDVVTRVERVTDDRPLRENYTLTVKIE